jgi:hypothetical protein
MPFKNVTEPAEVFPEAWGFEHLVDTNSTNIFQAAIDVWSKAGEGGVVLDFTFGFIPLLLISIMYVRTERIIPSLMLGLLSTWGIAKFGLLSNSATGILYTLLGVGIALAIGYGLFNRNQVK